MQQYMSKAMNFHSQIGAFWQKLKEDFKFDCSHFLLKAQGSTLFKGLNEGGCVKRRVEARGSLLAEVRRPRLVSGSGMNKASLISECRDASAALQA